MFVGPRSGLQGIIDASSGGSLFLLERAPGLLVLPLTLALHEALHAARGTGAWLSSGPQITCSDMALAEAASRSCRIAYLEADYGSNAGSQSAVAWADGVQVLGPATMSADQAAKVAPGLWPVNAALKIVGVPTGANSDAFLELGLARFHSSEDMASSLTRAP